MRFAPNEGSMYANINYVVMALVIETITGKTYKEYMEEEVFKPLGMTTALIDYKGMPLDNRVKGYDQVNGELKEVPKSYDYMFGAGDVVGTLLTAKIFIPSSSSGDVEVPKTVTGGRCEIVTDTGDIRISLK